MSIISVTPVESGDDASPLPEDATFTPLAQEGCIAWWLGRRPNGETFIIASAASGEVTFQSTQLLKNEYALSSRLAERWAIKPSGNTRYHGHYTLIYPAFTFRTLHSLIATPPVLIADYLRNALQLCFPLGQAHRQGIVHGDITPAHFFINDDGTFRLGGFGVSSLAGESTSRNTLPTAGTSLAYISPEHTGRTPHPVNSLSDLYSLGMVLYEMLTGKLPFGSPKAGQAEWIHHHIATAPRPPEEVRGDVPKMLSRILLRLLAKSPLDGYQTIEGLMADLRRCQATLTEDNQIAAFTPGLQERFTRRYRSETLFTRHPQGRAVVDALDDVRRSGTQNLVMISGAPGTGKSSLIATALKEFRHRQILLAVGKAEQHTPVVPYSVLTSAFRTVILYLLGLSAADVSQWRAHLMNCLGDYAALAVDLVPELKQLLGIQSPGVTAVNALDAQERFNQMACGLVKAFATPGRPLVMIIDDVHWADYASLHLLENLVLRNENLPFLLILAHRDAESMPCPLMNGSLNRIRNSAARGSEITPVALSVKAIARWLRHLLHTRTRGAVELAQLIHEKTRGNPLFIQEFFRHAVDDGLIFHTQNPPKWRYDRTALSARQYTDNVASLMIRQLERMPDATRQLVGSLACLGGSGSLSLLSKILGIDPAEIQRQIDPAVIAQFVTVSLDEYVFTHDRVHDAAFSLVGYRHKQHIHQQAAHLLSLATQQNDSNVGLFRAVYHIAMIAREALTRAQSEEYYRLSLLAAQRAKRAGDYVSALRYLDTARALLTDDSHRNAFTLGLEQAECEFLQGNLTDAQRLCTQLLAVPATLAEKSVAACLSAEIHMRQSDNYLALETALGWLAVFGLQFNREPDAAECNAVYFALKARLGDDPQALFTALPLIQDSDKESVLNLMASTIFASSYDCPQLHLLLVCKILEMTLDYGVTGASAFGLAWFSVLIIDRYQEYHLGFKCGVLATRLAEQHDFTRFKARTLLPLDQVAIWTQPLTFVTECVKESFNVAVAHGDRSFACLALRHQVMNYLTRGDHLDVVLTAIERGLAFTRKSYYPDVENVLLMQKQFVMHLRDTSGQPFTAVNLFPVHLVCIEPGIKSGPKAMVQFWSFLYQGMAHFYAREYQDALRCFALGDSLVDTVPGYIYLLDLYFYSALAYTVPLSHENCTAHARHEAQWRLEKIAFWATLNPTLFADKAALIRAEMARLDGNIAGALTLYESAISLSRAANFIHINALAHELAGQCAEAFTMHVASDAYYRGAIGGWDSLGAVAKVRQLEHDNPQLVAPAPGNAFKTVSFMQGEAIRDLESVVTAVRALTEEINLDRLIHILMRMLLERSGAQRCMLIRVLDGNIPEIEARAEATADGINVRIVREKPAATDLPLSVLSAVIRTGQEIRTGKPEEFSPFSQDAYLVASGAAVMCVPMFKQANMVGVLYLENRLMPDVFTVEHSHIVKTLSAQAAVSLETARLYAELLEENIHRRRIEKQLRSSQTSLMLGEKISHTGTWRWEIEHDMMYVSDEYGRILGLPEDQKSLSMADFLNRVHPDDYHCIHELIYESVHKGVSMQADFRVITQAGACRYIKGIGDPASNWPELKEYFGTISDITLQRQAEDAARIAQADLARVSRATTVGQLTASIAHEINQPLMSIVANAGASLRWLKREPMHLENASHSLNEIISEGKRAGEIIRGLQSLTRNHDSVFAPANLHFIARDILMLSRIELERRSISLELVLRADNAEVFCDRVQLQQVLLNLVVNAIDAMSASESGIRKLTLCSFNPTPESIRFEVLDTGTGLTPEVEKHIFDSFYTTKKDGMGMGLAISQGIIKKHLGELSAENRPERGCRFWFILPTEPLGPLAATLQRGQTCRPLCHL